LKVALAHYAVHDRCGKVALAQTAGTEQQDVLSAVHPVRRFTQLTYLCGIQLRNLAEVIFGQRFPHWQAYILYIYRRSRSLSLCVASSLQSDSR
jgi:hypothetical protein